MVRVNRTARTEALPQQSNIYRWMHRQVHWISEHKKISLAVFAVLAIGVPLLINIESSTQALLSDLKQSTKDLKEFQEQNMTSVLKDLAQMCDPTDVSTGDFNPQFFSELELHRSLGVPYPLGFEMRLKSIAAQVLGFMRIEMHSLKLTLPVIEQGNRDSSKDTPRLQQNLFSRKVGSAAGCFGRQKRV